MAYTRIKELDGFDTGPGGSNSGNPIFWPQDVLFLESQPDYEEYLEVNIIFRGENLNGAVGSSTAATNAESVVLLQCPPYREPLVEKFKEEASG